MAGKKQKQLDNPFVFQGYEGPEYFCDRVKETENLISALRNGRNITLISPRKIGKTGLINHTFYQIKAENKDAICIYVDIFSTKNLQEFVELLCKTVIEDALEREKTFANKVLDFFKGLRPTISPDLMTGMPTVSVSVVPAQAEYTLKSVFSALLRSYIQFIHHVNFIFSGSKKHLMEEMFCTPNRPFYQSTQLMNLEPLQEDVYYDFANKFFEAKKGSFSQQVFHDIYQRFDGYTWYLQAILNRLYEQGKKVETDKQAVEAILFHVNALAPHYQMLTSFLTDNQFSLLKAIARAELVEQPLSNEFIKRYELPSTSSVKSALSVLVNKDMVYQTTKGYIIYDRFLGLWLKRL